MYFKTDPEIDMFFTFSLHHKFNIKITNPMSTNNILSLLATGQQNRGRSLANRHGNSPTFSFMPRSTSSSFSKHQPQHSNSNHKEKDKDIDTKTEKDNNRMSKLFKMVHLLNVKVKQNYYFPFCKM